MMAALLAAAGVTAGPAQATLPGANGKIAFSSARDGNAEIYTMNPDGSAPARIANSPGGDQDPAFSPDGASIAFASTRDAPFPDIYVMQADGSAVSRVTNLGNIDYQPEFAPDNTTILYARQKNANDDY